MHRNVIIMLNAFLPRFWLFFWHNLSFFKATDPLLMLAFSLTEVSRRRKSCMSRKMNSILDQVNTFQSNKSNGATKPVNRRSSREMRKHSFAWEKVLAKLTVVKPNGNVANFHLE